MPYAEDWSVSGPKRIQRKRTKGWRAPPGVVNVTRGSRWGNPFRIGDVVTIEAAGADSARASYPGVVVTREVAVLLFRIWISGRLEREIRDELAGKDLMCWCPLDEACHADVLLEIANRPADQPRRSVPLTYGQAHSG